MTNYINNPVFLCGHRKTGTTMLLALLDNHPELLVYPADSGFFYAYYPRSESEKWSRSKKVDVINNFCIQNLDKEIKDLQPKDRQELNFSIPKFRKDFTVIANKTKLTPKDTLKSLIKAFSENTEIDNSQSKHWVEKTTSTEIYATEIIKWFPQAKFIHLVRDPRDNWASLKSGWTKRYKKFNDSYFTLLQSMFDRGKLCMEMAIHNQKIIGEKQYLVLRYEDVVNNPKKYLREIAKFLDINYDNSLMLPTVLGKWWKGNNFEGMKFKGPSNASVGKWPKRITKEEAYLIEYYFYDLMKHFKYKTISTLNQRVIEAVKHYKWYNFAQRYSFKDAKLKKYTKSIEK